MTPSIGTLACGLLLLIPAPKTGAWPIQPSAPSAETQPAGSIEARLGDALNKFLATTNAPGITLGIVKADGSEIALAAGVSRRVPEGDPAPAMRPTDRMMSGSVGKTYFAATFMLLAQDGMIDLDAPIGKTIGSETWFSRIPNAKDLTLRLLLRHQSGIPEHVAMKEFHEALRKNPQANWSPEEILQFILDKPALFEAGKGWSYADTNYILAGLVVERITRQKAYDLLDTRVIQQLSLRDTGPNDKPHLRGLVSGYTFATDMLPVPEEVAINETYASNPQFEWTGGGLIFTAIDLARFGHNLFGGTLVSNDSLAAMLDGVSAPRLGKGATYGLGVITWKDGDKSYHGHSGWFPGYIAQLIHDPETNTTLAVQVNTDKGIGPPVLNPLTRELFNLINN